MEDIRPLKKFGKPYLIPFYCNYKGKRCFGKLFYINGDYVKKKYDTEVTINRGIVKSLLAVTPHVPKLIKVFKTFDGESFYSQHKDQLSPNHVKMIADNIKFPAKVILYEDVGKQTLRTNINRMNINELEKVLFQILYTLLSFEAKGLCHGDMYIQGNVMIRKMDNPSDLHYKVGNTHYLLPKTRWFASVIDFDLASQNASSQCNDLKYLQESIKKFSKRNDHINEDSVQTALTNQGKKYIVPASKTAFDNKFKSKEDLTFYIAQQKN